MTDAPKSPLDRYLAHCRYEKNLSPFSLKAYQLDLQQFFKFIGAKTSPAEVDKELIKSYMRHLFEAKLRESSIRRKMISVKAFFSYLEYEDEIVVSPFRKLRISIRIPRTLPYVMSLNEIETLLSLSREQLNRIRTKRSAIANASLSPTRDEIRSIQHSLIFELLFISGMRVGELSKLDIEEIDLSRKTIRVHGKGSKERIVPVTNEEVLEVLRFYKRLREIQANGQRALLVNRLGLRMSTQSIRSIVQLYAKKAKLERHITPHSFRHTTATLLLENGTDIRVVQQLLGHSSITMTQKYTHISDTFQRKSISLNHPRNSL